MLETRYDILMHDFFLLNKIIIARYLKDMVISCYSHHKNIIKYRTIKITRKQLNEYSAFVRYKYLYNNNLSTKI